MPSQNDAAAKEFNNALQVKPHYAEANNNLGVVLARQEKPDKAIARYLEALRIRPNYVAAHNNLGVALAGQGKLNEAIFHYSEALRIKPDFPEAHNGLGLVLVRQEKHDEAVVHYSKALRVKPDYAEAHFNLGNAYQDQGLIDMAIKEYKQTLFLRPSYIDAHNNLGTIYYEKGMMDMAIARFKEILKVDSEYLKAYSNHGAIYYQKGLPELAIEQYRMALRIQQDPDVYYNKSMDNGKTFTTAKHISYDVISGVKFPCLAVDKKCNIYVAWVGTEKNGPVSGSAINFAKSTNKGDTFTKSHTIPGSNGGNTPSIAVSGDGNTVYLSWTARANNKTKTINFSAGLSGGQNWNKPVELDRFSTASSKFKPNHWQLAHTSSIAVYEEQDGKNVVYIAWAAGPDKDNSSDEVNIYLRKGTNGGKKWAPAIQVNDDSNNGHQFGPALDVDGSGNPYIAWRDSRMTAPKNSGTDIYFAGSSDKGKTFGPNKQINQNPVDANNNKLWYSRFPSIKLDDNDNIYIAWDNWKEMFDGWDGEEPIPDAFNDQVSKILLTRSLDGGKSFDKPVNPTETDLVNTSPKLPPSPSLPVLPPPDKDSKKRMRSPSLTVDAAGIVHLIWLDYYFGALKFGSSQCGGQDSCLDNEKVLPGDGFSVNYTRMAGD